MPIFTMETTYRLPVYRQRCYEAETLEAACALAIADEGWDDEKSDVETSGDTYVTGAWDGRDAAYRGRALSIPSQFGEQVQRRADHFEVLLGLLKVFAHAPDAEPADGPFGVSAWTWRSPRPRRSSPASPIPKSWEARHDRVCRESRLLAARLRQRHRGGRHRRRSDREGQGRQPTATMPSTAHPEHVDFDERREGIIAFIDRVTPDGRQRRRRGCRIRRRPHPSRQRDSPPRRGDPAAPHRLHLPRAQSMSKSRTGWSRASPSLMRRRSPVLLSLTATPATSPKRSLPQTTVRPGPPGPSAIDDRHGSAPRHRWGAFSHAGHGRGAERERAAGTGLSRCGPRESASRLARSRSPEAPFMNDLSPIAADQAAPPSPVHRPDAPGAIIAAAQQLLPHLERGQRIDAAILRTAMEAAFGASDASGAWDWKTAYDACEAGDRPLPPQIRKGAVPQSRLSGFRLSALPRSPAFSPPTPAAPPRARPSSNSPRRPRSASRP